MERVVFWIGLGERGAYRSLLSFMNRLGIGSLFPAMSIESDYELKRKLRGGWMERSTDEE